jgi:hypothetical protein
MKIRLIDVMFLLVALSTGIYCGRWMSSTYGIIGYLVGFVLGTTVALIFLFSLGDLLDFILNWCRPRFPICKNGKCSRGRYTYIESLDNGTGAIFSCKCKTKYIMKREKGLHYKKALELLDDGATRPYMKFVRRFIIFGHWVEDSEKIKGKN